MSEPHEKEDSLPNILRRPGAEIDPDRYGVLWTLTQCTVDHFQDHSPDRCPKCVGRRQAVAAIDAAARGGFERIARALRKCGQAKLAADLMAAIESEYDSTQEFDRFFDAEAQ